MRNWEKLGSSTAGMRSYGIGLTRLRKLAKRIGRNRELAHALWKTDVYEARVIALLVDDRRETPVTRPRSRSRSWPAVCSRTCLLPATQRSRRRHSWSSSPTNRLKEKLGV